MGMNDNYWMSQAYSLALQAKSLGEVPVGAVVIDSNNQSIGRGFNQTIQNKDPTAHAEIVALRDAAKTISNHRLLDCTLYVTLEPCCMCVGALVHARIKRIVFATRDFKSGAAGSLSNLCHHKGQNYNPIIDEGMMQEACATLLRDFFKDLR
jgi:tRNA(adenine34) deaminase